MDNPFTTLLDPAKTKSVDTIAIPMYEFSGRYRLGVAQRPVIKHDNGFLDKYSPESPKPKDLMNYSIWYAKAKLAAGLCTPSLGKHVDDCKGEDLTEAVGAYLHYMGNTGEERIIDYGKFLKSDPNGIKLREFILNDAKKNIEVIGRNRTSFSVTSDPYPIGGKDSLYNEHNLAVFYPATVNWQRAIGGHALWVSADVNIDIENTSNACRLRHVAEIVFHMEDMYNFNPGMKDIATGIPDEENGRFQVVGLAKQYLNTGTYKTKEVW